jgi:hypothetical protein
MCGIPRKDVRHHFWKWRLPGLAEAARASALYAEAVNNMATRNKPEDGASQSVIERHSIATRRWSIETARKRLGFAQIHRTERTAGPPARAIRLIPNGNKRQ